eukprot:CAMPEP_0197322088 /NCGR_PEP_ID=MMETSP0891-20130614/68129_1 /TAXON_ID=44058 ORGANISM="Aureoumbra lagunensis, Strain CCMP1510" /NCGR_SAMPLE_ID=MMETSP0891 /ASSEMBLY_ACC=CAM_ASM_000534 /LENGTH=288 /DNA_ID=CAMNT_0042814309 /DNA_START=26 /DNA_END=889 /DNA_ORIENTATION=+
MTKLLLLLLLTVQIVSGFVAYSSGGSKFPAKAQINEISVSNGRRAVISQSTAEACVVDLDLATVKWGVCATESGSYRFNCVDVDFVIENELPFSLVKDPGLGIELTEVANNGQGVGVVIVSGTVDGSPAASSPLQPGDVIAKVNGRVVEAYTYDDLVDVLVSASSPVQFETKRLRKRFKVPVTVEYPDGKTAAFEFYEGENIRRALSGRGVPGNDKTFGPNCGGDGQCATCALDVISGSEYLSSAGPPETIVFKDTPTWRMGCQASIRDDLAQRSSFKDDKVTIRLFP